MAHTLCTKKGLDGVEHEKLEQTHGQFFMDCAEAPSGFKNMQKNIIDIRFDRLITANVIFPLISKVRFTNFPDTLAILFFSLSYQTKCLVQRATM